MSISGTCQIRSLNTLSPLTSVFVLPSNWLRDYSQAVDIASLKKLPLQVRLWSRAVLTPTLIAVLTGLVGIP